MHHAVDMRNSVFASDKVTALVSLRKRLHKTLNFLAIWEYMPVRWGNVGVHFSSSHFLIAVTEPNNTRTIQRAILNRSKCIGIIVQKLDGYTWICYQFFTKISSHYLNSMYQTLKTFWRFQNIFLETTP